MIGLIALLILVGLVLLAYWVFVWSYRANRRKGKSNRESMVWAAGAVLLLSSPTWDAIPIWIAYEYYNNKEAGVKVFKTLEQWKAENPGVAETLKPYGFKDKRGEHINLGYKKYLHPLNDRFAYTEQYFDKLFMSVHAHRLAVIDFKTKEVLVRYVEVGSGNAGGLASGGPGMVGILVDP
jgi:heme/copper-type cytochrome/quinol oxidase subunit 2